MPDTQEAFVKARDREEKGKREGEREEGIKSFYSSTNNNLPHLQLLACFSHFCSNSKLPGGKSDSKLRSNTSLLKINVFLKENL